MHERLLRRSVFLPHLFGEFLELHCDSVVDVRIHDCKYLRVTHVYYSRGKFVWEISLLANYFSFLPQYLQ